MPEINTEEVLETNIAEELNFVETDAEVINNDLVSKFEEHLGETLAYGDERRIFLQGFAYVLADQLNHINETGRSNLLRYAIGGELDALGETFFKNPRLKAESAKVTLRFTLSQAQSQNVVVPKGARVTPDGELFFATDEAITFPANTTELSQDVSATATSAGSNHNDCSIGSINILVDTNSYISKVENITASNGGTDEETDEEYRERLRESPFAFSVAGPANAYRALAMSVSGDIADVAVYSPSAGVVEIAVVLDDGEIPSESDSVLNKILETCSAKDNRPLTDNVRVVPATAVETNINVTYYIANKETAKKAAIEASVTDYQSWQYEKIGRAISPDKLRSLMYGAGAARVEITEPTYQALAENEIAQFGTVTITYGGAITI